DVAPIPTYRYIYPLPEAALMNLAYYFTYGYREPQQAETYVRPFLSEIRAWKRANEWSDLFAVDLDGRLLLWDLRPAAVQPLTVLSELQRALYLACDAACDL